MHTYIPTYLPTYLHTYIHTYMHTYIHTACAATETEASAISDDHAGILRARATCLTRARDLFDA